MMRASAGSALRVGLLVAVTVALLIGLVLLFAGGQGREGRTLESYFSESVQGLDVGAAVKFRGVTLGQVTRIALAASVYATPGGMTGDSAAARLVLVRYTVDPAASGSLGDIEHAIGTGLRARLASQGLSGLVYLELDYHPPTDYPVVPVPWTPAVLRIPSVPSTLTVVKAGAEELLGKLDQVDYAGLATSAAAALHDVRSELESGDVHTLLGESQATLAALHAAVTQSDLPALSHQARATLSALQGVATDRHLPALLAHADTAVTRLSDAVVTLPPLIAALQATTKRADSTAADLQAQLGPILTDAQATMQNFRDLSARLRQDPGLVFSAAPPADKVAR